MRRAKPSPLLRARACSGTTAGSAFRLVAGRRRGRPRLPRRPARRRGRAVRLRGADAERPAVALGAQRLQAAHAGDARGAVPEGAPRGVPAWRSRRAACGGSTSGACTRRTSPRCATCCGRVGRDGALCLSDGFPVPPTGFEQRAVVGGDATSAAIAAASVIAKVTRDRFMHRMEERYPGWEFGDARRLLDARAPGGDRAPGGLAAAPDELPVDGVPAARALARRCAGAAPRRRPRGSSARGRRRPAEGRPRCAGAGGVHRGAAARRPAAFADLARKSRSVARRPAASDVRIRGGARCIGWVPAPRASPATSTSSTCDARRRRRVRAVDPDVRCDVARDRWRSTLPPYPAGVDVRRLRRAAAVRRRPPPLDVARRRTPRHPAAPPRATKSTPVRHRVVTSTC